MTAPAIEISEFSFAIGSTRILSDVSASVAPGEYWCVIGPNGAGKSTLLKCLDRVYRGGSGALRVCGRPLETYHQKELARLMSYVPQASGQAPPFSVHEFVMMGRYPHLSPFSSVSKSDEDAVRRALEMTDARDLAERQLATLSGGERQKVYIAAALAQEPKILLLDEPTTFLDYRHQVEILGLLRRINREWGATIVAVTHDINNAVAGASHILALKHGRVVFSGRPEEILNNETLRAVYDVGFDFLPHPGGAGCLVAPQGSLS